MILADVQALSPGNLITLYELDLSALSAQSLHFHGHDEPIVWQAQKYEPWAIDASNFSRTGGQQPRPTLAVGNIGRDENNEPITGVISALCIAYQDLVGAKLIRKRTLARYLDAVNFEGGNPGADPAEHLPDEVWLIAQKLSETPEVVTFALTSPLQFDGVRLPRRQIVGAPEDWAP